MLLSAPHVSLAKQAVMPTQKSGLTTHCTAHHHPPPPTPPTTQAVMRTQKSGFAEALYPVRFAYNVSQMMLCSYVRNVGGRTTAQPPSNPPY